MAYMKKPSMICIHHSAVSNDKNRDQFIATDNYHKEKWGIKSSLGYYVGYNYFISANGRLYKAREEGETTVAVYQNDMNDGRAVHVCVQGNFDTEKPYPEQIYALRDLLKDICKRQGISSDKIVFHRDYAPKTCPGNYLEKAFVRNLVDGNKPTAVVDSPSVNDKIKVLITELYNLTKSL